MDDRASTGQMFQGVEEWRGGRMETPINWHFSGLEEGMVLSSTLSFRGNPGWFLPNRLILYPMGLNDSAMVESFEDQRRHRRFSY